MTFLLPLLVPLATIWDWFYGVLSAMMQPIYWAISGLLMLFHNLFSGFMDADSGWTWTLAIVSLTVLIRTLLIPLFVKQINSSRKMQILAPKVKALQEKYAGDRERLGQETMKLYKDENANPAASCLPIFLQMPIFLGLFRVLDGASRGIPRGTFFKDNPAVVDSLRHARILGAEISGTFLPINVFGATQWVALVLIVLMTVTLFITQLQLMRKNMPPEALTGPMAQQQKMMLYLFPIIYMITGVSIPIGVMIYWFASNLWTMGQQYILIHNNPAPNTPAYVDWEERMRAKGRDPQAILRKRMGQGRRPVATASADSTKVARQSTARTTSMPAPPPAPKPDATTTAAPRVNEVRRQQPNRQSRSNRKQSRPKVSRPDGQ